MAIFAKSLLLLAQGLAKRCVSAGPECRPHAPPFQKAGSRSTYRQITFAQDPPKIDSVVEVALLQFGKTVVEVTTSSCMLLNIHDLHDAALGLRVLWVLYYRYIQFVFIFAECDVGRAIPRSDFEDVEKLALRR